MKTLAIVQARMGSTRFPDKVMKTIHNRPMIDLLLSRLSLSKKLDQIVVATSRSEKNDPLAAYVEKLGYPVYRGSEDDVLDRYYQTATQYSADTITRITGDCPLIDPNLVDDIISHFKENKSDYTSNVSPPSYPDGLDTEVFTYKALESAWRSTGEKSDREHVTPFIRESGHYKCSNISSKIDLSSERWTVDEPEDLEVVSKIFEHFHPRLDFCWQEVTDLNKSKPEIFSGNKHLKRNEGMQLGAGQKLYHRAKNIIPGGNMLLSKRPEMFLPNLWPSYFSKAKGCRVWDLDDNEYIDMSMSVGANVLGYGNEEVDKAVSKTVNSGNMSTLNCPEEVYLAEKLIELHPWAEMVRFARSGGEANAIAIRIARAASGRDKVAICGYHGWHDWYLSANIACDKNLDGHLLPGLEPAGIPRSLQGTVLPFSYNNFEELEALTSSHDIGVIKMEVQRSEPPKNNFLQKVRDLANEKNIVLIFDECTSGFRETNGGLHKKYEINPDIALFGKALGNGYAITSIIGKREIMEACQQTFISSTFWTERIGPTAALKTLEIMKSIKSWEMITQTGNNICKGWQQLSEKYDIQIEQWGLPALCGFSFKSNNAQTYKTFITQEMLNQGYLASTSVYVCTEHTPEILDGYFKSLDSIFERYC